MGIVFFAGIVCGAGALVMALTYAVAARGKLQPSVRALMATGWGLCGIGFLTFAASHWLRAAGRAPAWRTTGLLGIAVGLAGAFTLAAGARSLRR